MLHHYNGQQNTLSTPQRNEIAAGYTKRHPLLRMHSIRKLLAAFVFAFIATSGSAQTNGLNFDGSNDQVLIPNVVNSGSFTIEYWVKTTATASSGYQWYYGPGIVDAEVGGVTNDFGTALVGSKLAFGIGNPDVTIFSTTSINDGAWHHVAASWDVTSGAMKLYIDGTLEASGTGGTGNRTAPPNIAIGKMQTSVYYFNGSVDEVRIWNRVLCQSEITNNMSCQLSGTQTGLKGYYQCNQGTAGGTNTGITTLTDASGNSNDGTMSNFAMTGSTSNFVTGAVSGTCGAYAGNVITGTLAICAGNTTTLVNGYDQLYYRGGYRISRRHYGHFVCQFLRHRIYRPYSECGTCHLPAC
jgi:hypothetical protein